MHIQVFGRNSLLQAEVVRRMKEAVKKQKPNALLIEAQAALKEGVSPVLATKGVSGAYWMRGADRRIVGLFKPFDEEMRAPNNPMGAEYQGSLGLRRIRIGCRVGESPHHEVGAFVVDEFFGFGIVPKTYYAEFTHRVFYLAREDRSRKANKTKYGSFQEFVEGFVSLEKLTRKEVASIPLDEFQLLVVLDVIIGNTDRNVEIFFLGQRKRSPRSIMGSAFRTESTILVTGIGLFFAREISLSFSPLWIFSITFLMRNWGLNFKKNALSLWRRCSACAREWCSLQKRSTQGLFLQSL